jgi:hypothetical protein
MGLYYNDDNFDVRLNFSHIDLVIDALKNNLVLEKNDEKRNEINMLISMFSFVEKDTLNSFVD